MWAVIMQSGLLLCYVGCDCAKWAAIMLHVCGLSLCKLGCYFAMWAVIVLSGLLLCYVVCDCAKRAAIMLWGL